MSKNQMKGLHARITKNPDTRSDIETHSASTNSCYFKYAMFVSSQTDMDSYISSLSLFHPKMIYAFTRRAHTVPTS